MVRVSKASRLVAAAASVVFMSLPVTAATVVASYHLGFEATPSMVYGAPLDADFSLSDHITATITQSATDTAQIDLAFTGGTMSFAGFFLEGGTSLHRHSGGHVVQDSSNARSIFGDRAIPRGLSFANGVNGFRDGDLLSITLAARGLDIEDWSSFLSTGNRSGLFGGLAYVEDGSIAVFGLTGLGPKAVGPAGHVPAVAAVPLPAGGILLLGGLGLLAILRRRRT